MVNFEEGQVEDSNRSRWSNIMKLRTALLAAALAGTVGAQAADLPPMKAPQLFPAVQTWTGWELGVGIGGRWDTLDISLGGPSASFKPSSFEVGGFSLLNYEFPNHVVVLHKLTFSYANPTVLGVDMPTWRVKTGPGLGYDFGPVMAYFSGGAAAQTQSISNITNPALGWYIGPGLEFKPFGNDIVLGVDANYVQMNGFQVAAFKANTNSFDVGGHVAYLFH